MDHQTKSTLNQLRRIKILNPAAPNRSTGLINGECSGILNWNDVAYPSFYRTYKELSTNFWIPDEVDMKGDVQDYKDLSGRERNAYDSIIGMLATLDSPQTRFMYNVAEYLTDSSAHANVAIIGQQEAVHNESYSYALSSITTLDEQKRIFDQAKTNPLIIRRNAPIMDSYNAFLTNKDAGSLINSLVHSALLEGVSFYSGFYYMYNLARQNRMNGTAKIISFINRDELAHTKFVTELIRALLGENASQNTDALTDYVNTAFREAVRLEDEWTNNILDGIDGIDLDECTGYIKYRANKMAGMLGIESMFPEASDDNNMPWIRAYVDNFTETKTDFFETRNASYRRTSGDNQFDDL